MARFHFSLRSFNCADVNAAMVSQRTLRALHLDDASDASDASDAQEIVQGPGWFDSSWELVHGLEVREGAPGDARLAEWLDACVRADPLALPARSARVDALQFGDLDLAGAVAAAEAAPRDAFEQFGIDGLTLA